MKAFRFLALALCAAALAVSCETTIDIIEIPADTDVQTFTCVIDDTPASRLGIASDGKTSWEVGDQIMFHGKWIGYGSSRYYSRTVTLAAENISADGKTATVTVGALHNDTPSAGCASNIYAVYPADAVSVDNGSGSWRDKTPFTTSNKPIMVGYNKEVDGSSFSFINVCSVITFTVSGDYDSYEFSGNNGETVGYSDYQVRAYWTTEGEQYANLKAGGTPLTTISGPVTANGTAINRICIPAGVNLGAGFTLRLLKGGVAQKRAQTSTAMNLANGDFLNLGSITSHLKDMPTAQLCRSEYLGTKPAVIAYLTQYTDVSTLDATNLTHINYAHGRFVNKTTGDGGIEILTGDNDLMANVLALRTAKSSLKVLLMIGGWGSNGNGFSMMARDPEKRTAFCQACKNHIDTYGFDGIDIDWEYPGGGPEGNEKSDADALNFNAVLRELRTTIGDTKIISVASSADAKYIDWSEAILYVDYVNVMTYDMGKPPYKHDAPLYRSTTFDQFNCHESIAAHEEKGIPANRLVLGVPFYGKACAPYNTDPESSSVNILFHEMASILNSHYYVKGEMDVTDYNNYRWDDVAKVPYLVDGEGNILVCYDDAESVAWKGKYAHDNGLMGVMFWEYRHDDASHTLLQSLAGALAFGTAPEHTPEI